jgi:DNA-binding transcriptional MerR regulator
MRALQQSSEEMQDSHPVRVAAALTGLSPEVLRAWEQRHGAISPLRTAGGTRRYTAADLERLRWLKRAVDSGHRIGEVAKLDLDELRSRVASAARPERGPIAPILAALERLASDEARHLLALQLAALGPTRFAQGVALPLLGEIGERWAAGRLGVAPEHLATGLLRSMLGAALQPTASSLRGPRLVFATPRGEPHELGLLMAAVAALGAGANPLYLGAGVATEDLLDAVERSGAAALALGLVTLPAREARRTVRDLREGLPASRPLWLGGRGAASVPARPGIERIDGLEDLEHRIRILELGARLDGA